MDDELAAAEMTDYLVSLGHRRIGFIAGPDDHPSSQLRETGFRASLDRHGISLEPGLLARGNFHFESALRAAEALLSTSTPPTAIFASNDDMAAGVLAVAYRRGIRIPADLSVVGFDDTPLASVVVPSLTTIYQPIREMAAQATSMLLGKADMAPVVSNVLPPRLVERESSGPAKA
jgi:LacI family transcriptional regulator